MARVKRGVTAHARHKKVLELAKGYRGRNSSAYRIALEKVEKALRYAYRDRRNKKRDFRGLWIQRINAAAREHGLTYSQLMHGLKRSEEHTSELQSPVHPPSFPTRRSSDLKSWSLPRAIAAATAALTVSRSKRSRRRCATPIATAATKSAIFAGCGSSESMQLPASTG